MMKSSTYLHNLTVEQYKSVKMILNRTAFKPQSHNVVFFPKIHTNTIQTKLPKHGPLQTCSWQLTEAHNMKYLTSSRRVTLNKGNAFPCRRKIDSCHTPN